MIVALLYYLFYAVVWVLAWLPLGALYCISDFLFLILYYLVGYRKKVVRENLKNSFPEKNDAELLRLEKDFYRHFTDIFIETIKLLHVSDEEMEKRMHFSNPEMISDFVAQGKSVVILLGHYGNWEWIPSIYRNYDNLVGGELYRPLKNRYFDSFFLKLRGRFGTLNIPKNDALRTIVKLRREGKLFALGFIADQTPSGNNLHYWAEFLNQDTPFLNGPERIAKSADCAVVYFDVKVEKRGYYSCDLICVSENAKSEPENRITDRFVELFETTIRRAPAYWLWSHRRWKHKRVHTS